MGFTNRHCYQLNYIDWQVELEFKLNMAMNMTYNKLI
jgi:hypothetical protein